jgi:tetratricopeptide (TPR) repeat protein
LGEYQKALDILASKRFFPWEGGEGTVSSQYVHAHLGLGLAALETARTQEALQHFQAAQVYPENLGEARRGWGDAETPVYYYEGLAHAALGETKKAEACFEKASHEHGWLGEGTYYQALALKKLGKEQEGVEKLEGLRDYALRQAEAEVGYGYFYTSLGDFMLFDADLPRLNEVHTTYLAGLAYLGLGQTAQAKQAFQEVLALDANHLGAHEMLGSI